MFKKIEAWLDEWPAGAGETIGSLVSIVGDLLFVAFVGLMLVAKWSEAWFFVGMVIMAIINIVGQIIMDSDPRSHPYHLTDPWWKTHQHR